MIYMTLKVMVNYLGKQRCRHIALIITGIMLNLLFSLSVSAEVLRIGVLTPGLAFNPLFLGFKEGLSRHGFEEGKNISYLVEDTQGKSNDLALPVERLLAAKPDMLFTVGTLHAMAAKKATADVPIVFAWVGDPVQAKLIEAYAAPHFNATGVSTASDVLSGKRLEALLDMAPQIRRVLAVVSPREYVAQSSLRYLEETAKKKKVRVIRRDAANEEELKKALAETPRGSVDAIYHIPSYLGSYIGLLIAKAKEDMIPLMVHEESMVKKGALVSYGPDFYTVGVQSSRLAAKILKGDRPANIPSEMPERLLLVINMGTAKAIGMKIRREIIERADQLVE